MYIRTGLDFQSEIGEVVSMGSSLFTSHRMGVGSAKRHWVLLVVMLLTAVVSYTSVRRLNEIIESYKYMSEFGNGVAVGGGGEVEGGTGGSWQ